MTVGVLAASIERARNIIDNGAHPGLGDSPIALSPRSLGHRGREFEAIFVDAELWPLNERLAEEFGPCLYRHGGGFFTYKG